MTADVGAGTRGVRAVLAAICGMVLVLAGLGHVAVNLTGARASHFELLIVYVGLVATVGLPSTPRARGRQRRLYVVGVALAVVSVLAPLATPDPALQGVERSVTVAVILTCSLAWAGRPMRGRLRNSLDTAQFCVGLFVADQFAAYGVGSLILIAWPDLGLHSWPLSVVGELVQEGCLLLVIATYGLATPTLVNWSGLRGPGSRWTTWRPIVIAALRVEFGVIVFQLVLALVLGLLHIDLASIGNATFPAAGDWQPTLPVALLLLALLPGVVEELVFRGVIFRAARTRMPLVGAVAIASGLFGLGHLSPDMAPANIASVLGNAFVLGCLAAVAYQRTGSLYAAILAHVLNDTGPALAVVLPHEVMPWVVMATWELSVIGMLPIVFGMFRRQRQRLAAVRSAGRVIESNPLNR